MFDILKIEQTRTCGDGGILIGYLFRATSRFEFIARIMMKLYQKKYARGVFAYRRKPLVESEKLFERNTVMYSGSFRLVFGTRNSEQAINYEKLYLPTIGNATIICK